MQLPSVVLCCCSLRAKYAIPDVAINQLHGSDTDEKALQEIAFFFPLQHTVAVIKPDVFHTKGNDRATLHYCLFLMGNKV
jgi:Nucleoside diphosphate kinase